MPDSPVVALLPVRDISIATYWPNDVSEGFILTMTDAGGVEHRFRLTLDQASAMATAFRLAEIQAGSGSDVTH